MKKYKRKQYLMDKGAFQYGFLLPFVVSWFLATLIATFLFNWLVRHEIEKLLWKAHVTVHTTDEIIGAIFIYTVAVTLVLVLAFVHISCLLVRKKANGVALRMVNDLGLVAAGDFATRVRLRRKDAFRDVAASLNDFLEEKATRYRSLRIALAELQADLGNIRLAEARGALPAQELERLRGRAAMLGRGLARGEVAAPAGGGGAGRPLGGHIS